MITDYLWAIGVGAFYGAIAWGALYLVKKIWRKVSANE